MGSWDADLESGGMSVCDHKLDKLDGPTVPVLGWTGAAFAFPLRFARSFTQLNGGCSADSSSGVVSGVSWPFFDCRRLAACNHAAV